MNRMSAFLVSLAAMAGFGPGRKAETLPDNVAPVVADAPAQAYGPRSMFPRRRSYYLPALPFGETYQTPNYLGGGPVDPIAYRAEWARRDCRIPGTTRTIRAGVGSGFPNGFVHSPGLKTASDTLSDVRARQARRTARKENGLRGAGVPA